MDDEFFASLDGVSQQMGMAIGRMYAKAVEAAVAEGMEEKRAREIIGPLVGAQFLKGALGVGIDPERAFLDWLQRGGHEE